MNMYYVNYFFYDVEFFFQKLIFCVDIVRIFFINQKKNYIFNRIRLNLILYNYYQILVELQYCILVFKLILYNEGKLIDLEVYIKKNDDN